MSIMRHRILRASPAKCCGSCPPKVTRSALQNAASIAGLMLTTEVMITKIDEDEPKNKVVGAIR